MVQSNQEVENNSPDTFCRIKDTCELSKAIGAIVAEIGFEKSGIFLKCVPDVAKFWSDIFFTKNESLMSRFVVKIEHLEDGGSLNVSIKANVIIRVCISYLKMAIAMAPFAANLKPLVRALTITSLCIDVYEIAINFGIKVAADPKNSWRLLFDADTFSALVYLILAQATCIILGVYTNLIVMAVVSECMSRLRRELERRGSKRIISIVSAIDDIKGNPLLGGSKQALAVKKSLSVAYAKLSALSAVNRFWPEALVTARS